MAAKESEGARGTSLVRAAAAWRRRRSPRERGTIFTARVVTRRIVCSAVGRVRVGACARDPTPDSGVERGQRTDRRWTFARAYCHGQRDAPCCRHKCACRVVYRVVCHRASLTRARSYSGILGSRGFGFSSSRWCDIIRPGVYERENLWVSIPSYRCMYIYVLTHRESRIFSRIFRLEKWRYRIVRYHWSVDYVKLRTCVIFPRSRIFQCQRSLLTIL